ncbi:MAG: N-6 DNA methylase [Geobacteraceae bacterium]|nr:N-6 DNA methylase [Geobacteraceae bacterium]
MTTLARNLRKELENTVTKARKVAETGARKVLEQLGVHHHEPWGSMTPEQRQLRNRLRAHGRQLGDQRDSVRGTQAINRLVTECAYEQWHRMLFARFLAESDLLIEPDSGMPLTLDECQELAREQGTDWLELASTYAERMLPQIFRSGDPVLEVGLPPETRSELEDLLKALPSEVFLADDSLGWVYQFWQADRKEEVNKSGVKIGADELPAVTQLFTEDYMVYFLLHNTLGAWWAGKVLAKNPELAKTAASEAELRAACSVGGIDWDYLRFVQDDDGVWRPAAGTFDGWPKSAKEIKLLDPSMGSGHCLVFALPIMVAFRMAEEALSREAAVEAVLRDNIYGLEIDPRCTQIAAFNLAFAAWRMVGFRALPPLHLACSGLSLGVSKAEWLKLAEQVSANLPVPPDRDLFDSKDNLFSARVKAGLESLYDLFAKAPSLGSLIDPRRAGGDLYEAGFYEMEPLLAPLLAKHDGDEYEEMAVAAQGLSKAAALLSDKFTLVVTNVPYLGRPKQDLELFKYCETHHSKAKADLATCFVERCIDFCSSGGSSALVTPQNWLFLGSYKKLRESLLRNVTWNGIARLGPKGFQTPMWDFNICLLALTAERPTSKEFFMGIDVSDEKTPEEKDVALCSGCLVNVKQSTQLDNPDSRISFEERRVGIAMLQKFVECYQGVRTGDRDRFVLSFWEATDFSYTWEPLRNTSYSDNPAHGITEVLRWENGCGSLHEYAKETRHKLHDMHESGNRAWGKIGVAINQMSKLKASMFYGQKFDGNVNVIYPLNNEHLPALWAFCSSPDYEIEVRKIDQKLAVTNATLVKVPFDLTHWKQVAAEKNPNGLPKPFSSDPTQWLFNGHPKASDNSLQVAVARLLCYQWPRQTGSSFPDCPALGPDGLEKHVDDDGIVCLNPLKGEAPAAERLNALLADAYGAEWSAAKLSSLLTEVGYAGKSLDDWLRDGFFAQHCELFHQRPFVWHIWDGRRDGFHALVNYHLLAAPDGEGRRTLDKLIYTYLGDWIDGQRRDQAAGVEGADARLVAAEHLKAELEKIRNGEPPYDIFVRWKPLNQQPIGWEPDINDGVRLNIRPFMTAKPYGAKAANACILRTTPKNVKWDKDRGKDPDRKREDFPWFWGWDGQTENFAGGKEFDGNRWNDLHYTNEHKRAARDRQGS